MKMSKVLTITLSSRGVKEGAYIDITSPAPSSETGMPYNKELVSFRNSNDEVAPNLMSDCYTNDIHELNLCLKHVFSLRGWPL